MNFTKTLRNIKNIKWKELPKKLHKEFRNLITFLTYDKNQYWLEYIISLLATIEVEFPLIFDNEFRHNCNVADTIWVQPPQKEEGSFAQRVIPKSTFYCENCIFWTYSKVALFCYGNQCCGYCYYLGKGDFSFIRPTELLWDGCKECGRNEDIEEEECAEK